MKVKKHIEELKDWYGEELEGHVCAHIWTVLDVKVQAERDEIKISDEEATQIIDRMSDEHNAEVGVCWDVVSIYLHELEEERSKHV